LQQSRIWRVCGIIRSRGHGTRNRQRVGTRDNYVTTNRFTQKGEHLVLRILLRFKKLDQPEQVKSALKAPRSRRANWAKSN